MRLLFYLFLAMNLFTTIYRWEDIPAFVLVVLWGSLLGMLVYFRTQWRDLW